MLRRFAILLLAALGLAAAAPAELAEYQPREGLQGEVRMKGSDSIDPLIRLWVAEFEKRQPAVKVHVESPGSNTAPPALIAGQVQIGHMSREMNAAEIAAFQAARGHAPTRVVVALDALAVFVNAKNPLPCIQLPAVDAIYSRTRFGGWDMPLSFWGELGLPRPWRPLRIHYYGRDANSGSRVFFMEHVMGKKAVLRRGYQARDQFGVVDAVAQDLQGIGYGPLNYNNPGVRMLPLVAKGATEAFPPRIEHLLSGRYPLTRKLSLYVDKPSGAELPGPVAAFLAFVLSRDGQRLVQDYGSVPIPATLAQEQQAALGS